MATLLVLFSLFTTLESQSTITTIFQCDVSWSTRDGGNMFDVENTGSQSLNIQQFAVHLNTLTSQTITIYTKTGSYVGYETNTAAWTEIHSESVTGAGSGNPTQLTPLSTSLTIQPGGVQALFIHASLWMCDTTGTAAGAVYRNDGNIAVDIGIAIGCIGGCTIYSPYVWNGIIYYSLPTSAPTKTPTEIPTTTPSSVPTLTPTRTPTTTLSTNPSISPITPTSQPTLTPSRNPTTNIPTTKQPTNRPTDIPTNLPSTMPTKMETDLQTSEASSGKQQAASTGETSGLDDIILILIVLTSVFVCCILVLLIICFYRKKKREEAIAKFGTDVVELGTSQTSPNSEGPGNTNPSANLARVQSMSNTDIVSDNISYDAKQNSMNMGNFDQNMMMNNPMMNVPIQMYTPNGMNGSVTQEQMDQMNKQMQEMAANMSNNMMQQNFGINPNMAQFYMNQMNTSYNNGENASSQPGADPDYQPNIQNTAGGLPNSMPLPAQPNNYQQ